MPKPVCVQCNAIESLLWRKVENGPICHECYVSNIKKMESELDFIVGNSESNAKAEDKDNEGKVGKREESTPARATGKGTRKSARATRYKYRNQAPATRTSAPRGRGRRSIFKRLPLKAPTATATVVTSNSLFHRGSYMQVGDIVSMMDIRGGIFYAQIRGFLTDQYCEKSAVITWLIPTRASPPADQGFDPATYLIGPEEDLPRKLDFMKFEMHAPSDYYKDSTTPYPKTDSQLDDYNGFIWTSLEAKNRTQ